MVEKKLRMEIVEWSHAPKFIKSCSRVRHAWSKQAKPRSISVMQQPVWRLVMQDLQSCVPSCLEFVGLRICAQATTAATAGDLQACAGR
jgi:hypothetical protein